MGKNFFIFFIFLLFITEFAQSKSLSLSIYGGIGHGAEVEEVKGFNPGLEINKFTGTFNSATLGIKGHYYIYDSLDMSLGLAYCLRRAEVRVDDKSTGTNFAGMTVNRKYLQIPAMLRWGSGFYLGAGGYLALQLADARAEETDKTFPESVQHKTDYGLLAELGYKFTPMVSLGTNLEWGLPYLIQFPDGTFLGYKMKNRQFSLFMQLEFDLLN